MRYVNEENDIHYTSGLVEYSDFSINMSNCMESFVNQDLSMFFQKDNFFKDQNEFRLVILNKDVEKNFEINIGPLDFGVVETDKLVNEQLKLQLLRRK